MLSGLSSNCTIGALDIDERHGQDDVLGLEDGKKIRCALQPICWLALE